MNAVQRVTNLHDGEDALSAERSPSVDIVTVNWNAGEQLAAMLHSIQQADVDGLWVESVVVVDNGSTDDSLRQIENCELPLNILQNQQNFGFAKACNQGAAKGVAEFILFLNPDTQLFAESLSIPLTFMTKPENHSVAICGIRLVDDHGNATIAAARFPTVQVLIGKISGLSKIAQGLFPSHMMAASELGESQVVDQVIGAYFLIRRDLFEACHGFDERFFMYFEEVDLALRAKQLGYDSYYLADAAAYHKGGGTSDAVKATRLFYSLRSRFQYVHKHYPIFSLMLIVFLTFAFELPARLLRGLARGSAAQIAETLHGYLMLIRYFGWESRKPSLNVPKVAN